MRQYYVSYPRDFSNEYEVYVIDRTEAVRFEKAWPSAGRISRAEAVRLGIRRPAEAKRDGEQWFGGFVDGRESLSRPWNQMRTVAQRLDAAAADTLSAVAEREAVRAWAEECAADIAAQS